jgi:hypothetical protein
MTKFKFTTKTAIALYAMLAVVLSGCGSKQRSRYVCNCEEQKQLQAFVKESIKPANNMSDEEMEDVVHQLRVDGIKIYCKQKAVWVDNNGAIDWTKQKFDSCDVVMDAW